MSKHFSKGTEHASRQLWKDKEVIPDEHPLTKEEYEAARKLEEAASRESILALRKGWEEHQLQVRMAEIRKDAS